MSQPLRNIESLENPWQIVPKGHRSSESYATENTSCDKQRASVPQGVGCETSLCIKTNSIVLERK
jgi:hypothetical protein